MGVHEAMGVRVAQVEVNDDSSPSSGCERQRQVDAR
jgi:hypothetical protein